MNEKLIPQEMKLEDIKDLDTIMGEFAQYKIIKDEADRYLKEINEVVKAYMNDKGIKELVGTEHKFKLSNSHNTSFKADKLLAALPEAEEFMKITNFQVLKLA